MSDPVVPRLPAPRWPDPDPPLAVLRAALADGGLTDPARLMLAEAERALAALEAIAQRPLDRTVFAALLEMAGSEVAPELVLQLSADLRAVLAALAGGLLQSHAAVVGVQTHVLVALAGAAGARSLEQGAQALNRAARGAEVAQMHDLGPAVLAALAVLIGTLDSTCAGGKD